MRELANEIATLKEALAVATDDLIMAQANLDNDRAEWAERWIENVYFNLFMLSQRSEKLKALLAEGERKAAEKLKVKYTHC